MARGRGVEQARANIGRTVRWRDEEPSGVIVNVTIGKGGWPMYRVKWGEGAPEWWAVDLSAAPSVELIVGDD